MEVDAHRQSLGRGCRRDRHQGGGGHTERGPRTQRERGPVRDVAEDPLVGEQQHRRGRAQHQPQPAARRLAREDAAVQIGVGRRDRPQRDRLRADPDPGGRAGRGRICMPGSECRVPAQRAPRPVPGSSLITDISTGPSSALVPATEVTVARARVSQTTPKSVTCHPGIAATEGTSEVLSPGQVVTECVVRRMGHPPQRVDGAVVGAGPAALGLSRPVTGTGGTEAPATWVNGRGGAGPRQGTRSGVPAQDHPAVAFEPSTEIVAVSRRTAARRARAGRASGR